LRSDTEFHTHTNINVYFIPTNAHVNSIKLILYFVFKYEGWNFNSGNYLFTTDTK